MEYEAIVQVRLKIDASSRDHARRIASKWDGASFSGGFGPDGSYHLEQMSRKKLVSVKRSKQKAEANGN